MNPQSFRQTVLPALVDHFEASCICSNAVVRKIISFNFEAYGLKPMGLADSEILIQHFLLEDARHSKDWEHGSATVTCGVCGSMLRVHCEDYSIHMRRCYIDYEGPPDVVGPYLVGFYGFDVSTVTRIHDFEKVEEVAVYLNRIRSG